MSTKIFNENFHGSFFIVAKKLETAQISINKGLNGQTVVHFSLIKINKLLIHTTALMNAKEYLLYDSICRKFQNKENKSVVLEIKAMVASGDGGD